MTDLRSALRIPPVTTLGDLVTQMNQVLARLQSQDRRRYNLEPARKPNRVVTASESLAEGDHILLVNATGGAVTLTLPLAASVKGLTFTAKKTDASANAVTFDGNGSETIDGATTKSTTTQYAVLEVLSDGTGWHLI